MIAAWYEKQGPAKDVLTVGEMPDPHPAAGEVRIRVAASGINPGDIKKREDAFGYGMAYARVIPHSDGAGQVDASEARACPKVCKKGGAAEAVPGSGGVRHVCHPSPRHQDTSAFWWLRGSCHRER